jgi:hypothetical protein
MTHLTPLRVKLSRSKGVDIKSCLNIIRSSKIEGGESASRMDKEYGWGEFGKYLKGGFITTRR